MIIKADTLEQAIEKIILEPNKLNNITLVIDTRPRQLELFEVPKLNSLDSNSTINT